MVVLDAAVVNIALPTAQHDLGFSNTRTAIGGGQQWLGVLVGVGGVDQDDVDAFEKGVVEVRFIVNDVPPARRVIKRWAATTGHQRVWFKDEVADLEPPDGLDGEFGSTCPSCGFTVTDSGQELMKFVRSAGYFPFHCFICGSFIPQWEPVSVEAADRRTDSGRRRSRGSEHELRAVDA